MTKSRGKKSSIQFFDEINFVSPPVFTLEMLLSGKSPRVISYSKEETQRIVNFYNNVLFYANKTTKINNARKQFDLFNMILRSFNRYY